MKPINLNRARKDRQRAAEKLQADSNALRFGRTKEERAAEAARLKAAAERHAAHRREVPDEG